jgi:hypothetical protein
MGPLGADRGWKWPDSSYLQARSASIQASSPSAQIKAAAAQAGDRNTGEKNLMSDYRGNVTTTPDSYQIFPRTVSLSKRGIKSTGKRASYVCALSRRETPFILTLQSRDPLLLGWERAGLFCLQGEAAAQENPGSMPPGMFFRCKIPANRNGGIRVSVSLRRYPLLGFHSERR